MIPDPNDERCDGFRMQPGSHGVWRGSRLRRGRREGFRRTAPEVRTPEMNKLEPAEVLRYQLGLFAAVG